MHLQSLLAALALFGQGQPLIVAVEPGHQPTSLIDRLSPQQMTRFISLSTARLREARCTGYLDWSKQSSPALRAAVVAAVDHDSQLGPAIADEFVRLFAAEATESAKTDGKWIAERKAECGPILAMANGTKPLVLAPLNRADIVDPVFASCFARYTLAAEKADSASRSEIAGQADRARDLALKDKTDAAKRRAEQALTDTVADERRNPIGDEAREMYGLITCQTAMAEAEMPPEWR